MAAKKKTGSGYGNKTSFVMSLPRDMSARDVVAKAKSQGMVLSEAHVYKIRSTNKAKAPTKAKPPSNGASSAAPKAGASSSKRDFVLSFPDSTPAAVILKQAKSSGIALSKAYLYTIRAGAKGKDGSVAPRKPGRPPASAIVMGAGRRQDRSLETQFIDAALDIGLSRASELLDRVRSKLRDV